MSAATLAPRRRSAVERAFYDAKDLSVLTTLSERTIWRLADAGAIPGKVRIGRSVLWSRAVIDKWISDGCPQQKSAR